MPQMSYRAFRDPPSISGITWAHVAGFSPNMAEPETMGAGCAFLDYDNDGWMDIYLVNSGPCDFYTPKQPLRNALYHNNRDGTFTDVTEKAGVAETLTEWALRSATTMPMVFRIFTSLSIRTASFITITVMAHLPTSRRRRELLRQDGPPALFGSTTTTMAGSTSLSAIFVDYSKDKLKFCGDKLTGERSYCIPTIYDPSLVAVSQQRRWHVHRCQQGVGYCAILAKALGVVAADVNNDGWMDLFVGNDTGPNYRMENRGKGNLKRLARLPG